MWWQGPCGKVRSLMSPAEDCLLLLRLMERHLGSLKGTLYPAVLADEDWGFPAQQSLEKLLKARLVLHGQEPPRSHLLQRLLQELAAELLELDDFAVLARYDTKPGQPHPTPRWERRAERGWCPQADPPAGPQRWIRWPDHGPRIRTPPGWRRRSAQQSPAGWGSGPCINKSMDIAKPSQHCKRKGPG